MALSDWDVAALNEKSEPTSGVFKTLDGKYTFEIYKDNLSVYLGNEFLFTIYDGSFQIGGVDIVASRPKDKRGIYVVISEIRYRDIQNVPYRDENNKPTSKERILVGCGVDGWTHSETEFTEGNYVMQKVFESGKIEPIFITTYDSAQDVKEDVDLYNKNLDKLDPDPKGKFVFKAEPLGDYVWQGVTKQDIDALQKLYEDNSHYNNAKIDFTKALRYNAGDAYFAGKIEDFELPATAVGEADTPILSQALGMGGGKKDHDDGVIL